MMQKIKVLSKHKILRYLVVGGSAFVFEMSVLFILKIVLNFSPIKSVAISFWFGFVFTFLAQKFVTFKTEEAHVHPLHKQTIGYTLLIAWNYLFSIVLVHLLAIHLGVFVTRTIAIIIMMFWNFQIYKILFKTK